MRFPITDLVRNIRGHESLLEQSFVTIIRAMVLGNSIDKFKVLGDEIFILVYSVT